MWIDNIDGGDDVTIVFEYFITDLNQDAHMFNAFMSTCDWSDRDFYYKEGSFKATSFEAINTINIQPVVGWSVIAINFRDATTQSYVDYWPHYGTKVSTAFATSNYIGYDSVNIMREGPPHSENRYGLIT